MTDAQIAALRSGTWCARRAAALLDDRLGHCDGARASKSCAPGCRARHRNRLDQNHAQRQGPHGNGYCVRTMHEPILLAKWATKHAPFPSSFRAARRHPKNLMVLGALCTRRWRVALRLFSAGIIRLASRAGVQDHRQKGSCLWLTGSGHSAHNRYVSSERIFEKHSSKIDRPAGGLPQAILRDEDVAAGKWLDTKASALPRRVERNSKKGWTVGMIRAANYCPSCTATGFQHVERTEPIRMCSNQGERPMRW